MKFLKKVLLVILIAAIMTSIAACKKTEKKIVLKCGGIQSAEDVCTEAMKKMSEIVKEKTGGTIEIQVFPAGQLGNATSQVEAVGIGSQDMFVDAGSFVATFVPDKIAETMFFVFENEEHYKKYLASDLNKGMEDEFRKKQGIKIIANNWLRVPRSVSSKKKINSIDDMEGLKMRVPDIKSYLESVMALGAKPTQIAWGETYLALKQGVVDACESPMDSMYTMKFYEPTKYIVVTEHLRDNIVVMINDKKLSSLSDKQQQALVEAANEAGDWYSSKVKEKVSEYVELMKAEGTEFVDIDTTPMQQKVAEAAKKLEESGLWSKGLYDKIQDLK
jgi:tripartite ATP-independent transporter DctP family solute receptor